MKKKDKDDGKNNTITSYFKPVGVSKDPKPASRKRPIIVSDDDEPADSVSPKRNKKTAKKSRLLRSDDEESPKKKSANNEKATKVEKVVSTKDMFGKFPIKRVAAPKVEKKLKESVNNKRKVTTKEAEYHEDEEFENALGQLDTSSVDSNYVSASSCDTNEPDSKLKTPPKKPSKASESDDEKPSKKRKVESDDKKLNLAKLKKPESPKKVNPKKELRTSPRKTKEKANKTAKASYKLEVEKHSPKKKKEEDPLQKVVEKKKYNAALYNQYLARGGARNPGCKEIPEGAHYCLAGLRFLLTGIFESLEREEAEELIKKYGGTTLHAVTKKLDYLVVGSEPGPAKITKAEAYKIKQISEDDLLELIRTRPAGKESAVIQPIHRKKENKSDFSFERKPDFEANGKDKKVEPSTSSEKKKTSPVKEKSFTKAVPAEEKSFSKKSPVKEKSFSKETSVREKSPSKESSVKEKSFTKVVPKSEPSVQRTESNISASKEISVDVPSTQALVEKYRPKTLKEIIGQGDGNSNAQKLYKWLLSWHRNRKNPPKSSFTGISNPDIYKAALLSGPPGIGKTTTAQLVCKEAGFEFIEFNASDTRSKRLLNEEVAGILSNTTMSKYFKDGPKETKPKHVLIMDEIDGMSGNQDRGGVQELISLIKSTSVPIICICNDRNHPKLRTLLKYIYDLRFLKPKPLQIRAAMMSLCCKERIKIAKEDLDQLIRSTDQDVRQIINHIAMHSAGTAIDKDSNEKTGQKHKDIRLGIWDVARKIFSAEEHKNMSIHDKSDLFFHDYNISPLFVQENYLSVVPSAPKQETLSRIAEAAESIAIGDMIESSIRTNNAWSLLPTQAMFSAVIPGTLLSGRINAQIAFPNWLGRNAKRGKHDRLLQEITAHSRMTTGASKEAINLDYAKPLRDKIVRPLVLNGSDGVNEAIDALNTYHLLREDVDSLIEVSLWPGQRDPMHSVESKTKAAFTRVYNKTCMAHSYSTGGVSKKKKGTAQESEEYGEEVEEEEDVEEDDDINNDKMIKAKKPAASAKPSTSKTAAKPSTKTGTRGRGRGRGKTQK